MARKAGPGNGAEDAPEGRAELAPEEGGFVPDARIAEEPEVGAGLHPSSVGEDSRIEALSEEGLAALAPEQAPASGSSVPGLPESLPGQEASAAVPDDWRHATPSDDAPELETPVDASPVGTTPASSEPMSATDDPWGRDQRIGSDPLVLTTPLGTADGASSFSASASPTPMASESSTASLPPLAPPPPRRRGGFGALLLGGMIAAVLGFGAAWLAQDRLGLFPARLPADLEERLAVLEAQPAPEAGDTQALADRLSEVESRLTVLEEAPPTETAAAVDLDPLRQELSQGIEDAQARVGDLEQRIAALETRPAAPGGGEAPLGAITPEAGPDVQPAPTSEAQDPSQDILADLEPRIAGTEAGLAEVRGALLEAQAGLDALDERLDQAESQSASATEEAQAAAASLAEAESRAAAAESQARARAMLAEVEAALEASQPFEAALSELAATGVAVPDELAQVAAEGAPTLAELRDAFPEAARAGLAAARDQGLLDDGSGMLGFLRGQLSIRSVAPREGDDPDAVLSRAEAQLGEGDLDAALAEIDSLPEPVRTAMADWVTEARTRAQADAALADLRSALSAPDAPPAD